MDLNSLPLFRAMAKRMAWLGERQQTLAQNIANADTPGYAAQDLKPLSFRELVGGAGGRTLPLAATQPRHLAAAPGHDPRFAQAKQQGERTPSGNSVSMETEMMKVADTANEYSLASNLYRRHIAMMKTVLSRGTG